MSETKINVSQTTITAEDIGAASAFDTMPTASATTVGKIVQYTGTTTSNKWYGRADSRCVGIPNKNGQTVPA